jgi:lysylphosphatidylglycerol synthetase-like protein (DUF2156 family)
MKQKLYGKGIEKYPLSTAIGQNLFFVIYFAIALIGMFPLQTNNIPIVSFIYIVFIAIMLIFVLRKHLCTHCFYYGKVCGTGITWLLAMFFPLIGMIIALILNWASVTIVLLLVVFIILSGVNFLIHKKSCEKCKMRFVCPGSTAK